jgi:vacuolar-type H+-ATPase catalytic subunit A/Vma1
MSQSPAAINPLSVMATSATQGNQKNKSGTWYQAMAEAWGETLDRQANTLEDLSTQIGEGGQDNPSTLTLMSAEALKMGFLSQSSHTTLSSTGEALKTMAQKS